MYQGGLSNEYYNRISSTFAEEIAKCTPQLFSVENHKSRLPPEAFGTGVLLTVNRRYFLVTAAHCVHQIDLEHLGVMIGYDFCTIGGQLRYFEPNEEEFHANNSDVAVFELHLETVAAIKEKYDFFHWRKVELNHDSDHFSKYLIFGYPALKTVKNFPTKQITPEPLVLRTIGVPIEYYVRQQIEKNKTIVLNVNQKSVGRATNDRIEELPFLGGISGCGVWAVFDLHTNQPQYKLVALLTGEDGNKAVLYCSRIDNVKDILAKHFHVSLAG